MNFIDEEGTAVKIVLVEFHQESNSFNPWPSTFDFFRRNGIYEGEDIRDFFSTKPCAIAGMLQAIGEAGATAIPGYSMFTWSGGPVDQSVVDHFIDKTKAIIENNSPVDGVFISLHGATQTTLHDDCSGYILEAVRQTIGEKAVIAVSTDLHANITAKMMKHADVICGYQTYPHRDHLETGYRAAKLGLSCLLEEEKPRMARAIVPMIVPASGYTTMHGPFAELIAYAKSLEASGAIQDFSIYQMQPWLDVEEGGSAVVVIDRDAKKAAFYALELARKLFDLRKEFQPELRSIDEVIDSALRKDNGKPVILVDSADSSNAGATGDSVAVLHRLLRRQSDLKTAFVVIDAPAADLAHRIGVGKTATFSIGGTKLPAMNKPIRVEAYVKSLHDGVFTQEGPAGRGTVQRIGPAAVLKTGNIDILVCHHITGNGDPQLYRAFGIEPTFYQLVVVKACGSYRAAYSLLSDEMYDADTPGAASVQLTSLPFRRLPKAFFPFSELDDYAVDNVIHARE